MTIGLHKEITELIGKTPLVRLNRLSYSDSATIYGKVEFFNPGGSVKDRICLNMINEAERQGRLKPGGTIVEPTSGNRSTTPAKSASGNANGTWSMSSPRKITLNVMPEIITLPRMY